VIAVTFADERDSNGLRLTSGSLRKGYNTWRRQMSLQPDPLPNPTFPTLQAGPLFAGFEFQLTSTKIKDTHYLKIETQFDTRDSYYITGWWSADETGKNDPHAMTGYIIDKGNSSYTIICSWFDSSGTKQRDLSGTIRYFDFLDSLWTIQGKVVDHKTGVEVGPQEFVGHAL
jgi:hypothetical protein